MMKNMAMILLAIWLIVTGLTSLVPLAVPGLGLILNGLALAAGIVLLLGYVRVKGSKSLGYILLAVWLIVSGLLPLLNINFPGSALLLALLAIAAGILLLLRR